MSLFDYLFPALLILSVLRQVRGRRLNWFQLAWPVAVVIWAATKYVHGFPLRGGDLALVAASTAAGVLLGVFAGVLTRVYRRADGALIAKARAATIVLWVLGTAGRLVFGLYAQHGGGPAIASFSRAHHIAFGAWGAALILMALCEVGGRTLVLAVRALSAGAARPSPQEGGSPERSSPHWRETRPT